MQNHDTGSSIFLDILSMHNGCTSRVIETLPVIVNLLISTERVCPTVATMRMHFVPRFTIVLTAETVGNMFSTSTKATTVLKSSHSAMIGCCRCKSPIFCVHCARMLPFFTIFICVTCARYANMFVSTDHTRQSPFNFDMFNGSAYDGKCELEWMTNAQLPMFVNKSFTCGNMVTLSPKCLRIFSYRASYVDCICIASDDRIFCNCIAFCTIHFFNGSHCTFRIII